MQIIGIELGVQPVYESIDGIVDAGIGFNKIQIIFAASIVVIKAIGIFSSTL